MIGGLLIYVFNFWNFRGSFWVWFLVLKIWKLYFESGFSLLGSRFYKTFLFEASLYMSWFFGTLGSLFWVWFLVFENFEIVFWIRIPIFGGVCFIKLFDLRPPYICFWFFGTLGGLFWVWFLVFENFEIVFWIRIPTFGGSVLWNFLIWGFFVHFWWFYWQ